MSGAEGRGIRDRALATIAAADPAMVAALSNCFLAAIEASDASDATVRASLAAVLRLLTKAQTHGERTETLKELAALTAALSIEPVPVPVPGAGSGGEAGGGRLH